MGQEAQEAQLHKTDWGTVHPETDTSKERITGEFHYQTCPQFPEPQRSAPSQTSSFLMFFIWPRVVQIFFAFIPKQKFTPENLHINWSFKSY